MQTTRGGAARRPAPHTTAVARREQTSVAAYRDPQAITHALAEAAKHAHLVSPATTCGNLPAGCEVVLSQVLVDDRELKDGGDCYSLAGKMGLGKTALDKIAGAAGVSWDMALTGRLDNGSDPHYCHYRAVGRVRDLDGSERTISGEVEMDARDGSPQLDEIIEKAKRGNRPPDNQIRELRKFLIRHAESKAKNRAIRSLGVKTAYAPADLKKPFTVAKLMWTGRTGDPTLDRELAMLTADRMLGARTSLYGAHEVPRAALPASTGHAPPPIGGAVWDVDPDDEPEHVGDFHGAGGVHYEDEPPPRDDDEPPFGADPHQQTEREGIDTNAFTIRFGKAKGQTVAEADTENLQWLEKAYRENVDDPSKARFKEDNLNFLEAIRAELVYRDGGLPL